MFGANTTGSRNRRSQQRRIASGIAPPQGVRRVGGYVGGVLRDDDTDRPLGAQLPPYMGGELDDLGMDGEDVAHGGLHALAAFASAGGGGAVLGGVHLDQLGVQAWAEDNNF